MSYFIFYEGVSKGVYGIIEHKNKYEAQVIFVGKAKDLKKLRDCIDSALKAKK